MNRIALTFATLLFASNWMIAEDEPEPKPSDKPLEPTVIEAERSRSESIDDTVYFIFSGSVKLTATNLIITCNQLEVFASNKEEDKDEESALGDFSSIQKIVATGNVRIVQEERTATAGRMEVLPNEDVIVLDDDPMVFQDAITIGGPGTQLKIHSGNGRVEWTGDSNNKVRFSGPPIQDFGYEDDGKTIIPEEEEEEDEKAPRESREDSTDISPKETEKPAAPTSKKDDK